MPELPEVETMRRGILEATGGTIVRAFRFPCPKRPIEIQPRIDRLNKRVAGQQIASIDRLGKRVVLLLESGDRLLMEPRMTGLVLVRDAPTAEHLRFGIDLRKSSLKQIQFWDRRGLGKVLLWSPRQYQARLEDGSMGPDAMAVDWEQLAGRFRQSKREIKVAMLDQSRVLGIGNLYASEILHLAGVDPRTRCDQISRPRWQRIHQCLREVFEAAIRYEGSTLSDGTYRNALNDAGGYQNEHRVYDREGEPCSNCHNRTIERIVQAQRSTFFCRGCQKRR